MLFPLSAAHSCRSAMGSLLDLPVPSSQIAAYQHNSTDLEFLGAPPHGAGFMDYTDDSCMDFAAGRSHQRVSDGTSNTLQFGER